MDYYDYFSIYFASWTSKGCGGHLYTEVATGQEYIYILQKWEQRMKGEVIHVVNMVRARV